jgi:hypothetical protein
MYEVYNTLRPYKKVDYQGIQYSTCKEYDHICRYKGLRQIVHNYNNVEDRFVSHETANPFNSNLKRKYYTVTADRENRLDLIAYEQLGSSQYAWVIAYFNGITDGYTVWEGQLLSMPTDVSLLFNTGEILQSVPATKLNLSRE